MPITPQLIGPGELKLFPLLITTNLYQLFDEVFPCSSNSIFKMLATQTWLGLYPFLVQIHTAIEVWEGTILFVHFIFYKGKKWIHFLVIYLNSLIILKWISYLETLIFTRNSLNSPFIPSGSFCDIWKTSFDASTVCFRFWNETACLFLQNIAIKKYEIAITVVKKEGGKEPLFVCINCCFKYSETTKCT